jgi:hypothetical protein
MLVGAVFFETIGGWRTKTGEVALKRVPTFDVARFAHADASAGSRSDIPVVARRDSGNPVSLWPVEVDVHLAASAFHQLQFSRRSHAWAHRLLDVRQARRAVYMRKVLHHLQGTGQGPSLHGWPVLLPGLPGSV